ncbi:MAG TPA: 16S rRNA (guanine(966)-N(2))-methyltransferase RsmD [Micromonosporaceae bacterium]|nr:16S rRNA (guanine(966)-N(2))-methyltransferase RsmD [Micromonosporaceae bacterium]
MTRIIAGRLGGRRISTPSGRETRPTSDRVREALFSTLAAMTELAGARVADLYAGSGAIGLEALSRGAAHALLVEADPRAARVVRDNLTTLGVDGQARLLTDRVERVLANAPDLAYDVVIADPPYALPDARLGEMLTALVAKGWLAEEAVVVVERSTRAASLVWVPGIAGADQRRYGETTVWYGRRL